MIEIGSKVEAEVVEICPYGAWLRHVDDRILVMVPDFSWGTGIVPTERLKVGERVQVKITRHNNVENVNVGSIKALNRSENPYRLLEGYPPYALLTGVIRLGGPPALVELDPGIVGMIDQKKHGENWIPGSTHQFNIESLNLDEGELWLAPVVKENVSSAPTQLPIPTSSLNKV